MLKKLLLRNAKRQYKEYILYFVTLSCTISFIYAFNTLLFSDSIKMLSSMEILPYMLIATSLLIVFIMGWIISYMTRYMLKKRSMEFSIYILSGIPNRTISMLIFRENLIIGLISLFFGIPIGILLSQGIELIILHMFGLGYDLHITFSISAIALTLLYFMLMFLYSLIKNKKWIYKLKLNDLIYADLQNENIPLLGNAKTIGIFFLSLLFGIIGILIMYIQPIRKGFDVLIGTILLVLSLYSFLASIPTFLIVCLGKNTTWKYQKIRLIPFRAFTAKAQSLSQTIGILSVLFMLSISLMGTSILINIAANKNVELCPFDITILHNKELQDFSKYDALFCKESLIDTSYSYAIYTDTKKEFLTIRNHTIEEMGRFSYSAFAEFQYDTYIRQNDYAKLRKMLGYEPVMMNPFSCYIHCVPALENNFKIYIETEKFLKTRYPFDINGIFTEPFYQAAGYGNGLDYIIIVPDNAVDEMTILYSLYVAISKSALDSSKLQKILETYHELIILDRSIGKTALDSDYRTVLIYDNVDYLSGKGIEKGSISHLYALSVCLFYFALILEITGTAILATQILSDREKKRKQDSIFLQLGMTKQLVQHLNNKQLLLIFLIPILPAIIVAGCFIYICAVKIDQSAFELPVFSNHLWIVQSYGISLIFFLMLYGIYYIAAQFSYKQK